ncbi:HIT-like domain-containing protein [Pelagophyceae sp. CCMP2097]|nr:HIT-like domain-containing protein [Pelagophyceae sp. CCMP2097]
MAELAAKKARTEAPNPAPTEPAFTAERLISAFAASAVLRFENGGLSAVVQGVLRRGADDEACLVRLDQRAACADEAALLASLPNLTLVETSNSKNEYSYYDASSPCGASYSVEVISPASEKQVAKNLLVKTAMVEESGSAYSAVVAPFVDKQLGRLGWIDSVCNLESEKERNLFACDDFIINIDTKWKTHANCSTPRAEWRGAPWTRDLYLLAISRDASLRSLRDLRGAAGAALCRAMRDALRKTAADFYGTSAAHLRIFFHYQPQYYRLHAHCVRTDHCNPGSEVERAHLLTTVASNLDRDAQHYDHAVLTYKLKVGEELHQILAADAPDCLLATDCPLAADAPEGPA